MVCHIMVCHGGYGIVGYGARSMVRACRLPAGCRTDASAMEMAGSEDVDLPCATWKDDDETTCKPPRHVPRWTFFVHGASSSWHGHGLHVDE